MDWILWVVIAAACGLYLWRKWRPPQKALPSLSREGLESASDRSLVLEILRRELANYLVRYDPDRFLHLYRKARQVENEIDSGDNDLREAQNTLLVKRYPFYADFDLIGTRDHVLYADAFNTHAVDEIEEHYLNLVKFHSLQRAINPDWKFRQAATSEESLNHLQTYVQKIKDTRFKQRFERAVSEFFDRGEIMPLVIPSGSVVYETRILAVYHIDHFAENRYGFHFKDTSEFGLYSSFYDDERDKTYERFYRSDRKFEAETYLDHLRIEEPI